MFQDIKLVRDYCRAALMMDAGEPKDFKPAGDIARNKNFYVKNNKAYTEDNVLVQNIFVYNIPKKLSDENIQKHFSRFGRLEHIRVVKDKKRARRKVPKVAFVTYAKPEHACNVLQRTSHFVHSTRISVKAGDSWIQPKANEASSTVTGNNNIAYNPSGLHILSMNYDCLEIIFKMLNLSDQVRLARVCRRFQDIVENIIQRKYEILCLGKISRLTLWETRDFFRLAGKSIEWINGTIPYQNRMRIFDFLFSSCPNLRRITLIKTKLRLAIVKKMVSCLPRLRELNLYLCDVNDNVLLPLKNTEVKKAIFNGNRGIRGNTLIEMVQLEELSINGFNSIDLATLQEIVVTLKNLRLLDIRGYQWVNLGFITALCNNCKNLEVLKMSTPDIYNDQLALLPRLKHIELSYRAQSNTSQNRLLSALVMHKADQLEVLKLATNAFFSAEQIISISKLKNLKTLYITRTNFINDSALLEFSKLEQLEELNVRGSDVTDSGVLTMLKKCTKLHIINVQSCRRITDKLVNDAIEHLNRNGDRKLPLILYVYGTSIQSYALSQSQAVKTSLIVLDESALNALEDHDLYEDDWLDEDDELTDEDDDSDFLDSDLDDVDDEIINMAYDMFGQFNPHGFDINDVIW